MKKVTLTQQETQKLFEVVREYIAGKKKLSDWPEDEWQELSGTVDLNLWQDEDNYYATVYPIFVGPNGQRATNTMVFRTPVTISKEFTKQRRPDPFPLKDLGVISHSNACVLEQKSTFQNHITVVLAHLPDNCYTPFVTWLVNWSGKVPYVVLGHYFRDLLPAYRDFKRRR